MKNDSGDTEREVSHELSTNDCTSSGDSRHLEETAQFEAVQFAKNSNSSSDSRCSENLNLDPHIYVEKLGEEMKALFFDWSKEFIPSKECEEETMKRLDDLKNEAYILEVQFLENKLELVKKRITKT